MAIVRVWHSGNNSNPRDGDWASAAQHLSYATTGIEPAQAGDTILVAHDHEFFYTSNLSVYLPDKASVISVNRTTEIAQTGAKEGTMTNNVYFNLRNNTTYGSFLVDGMELIGGNNLAVCYFPALYSTVIPTFNKCTIVSVGGGMSWNNSGYGSKTKLTNCIFNSSNATSSVWYMSGGSKAHFINTSFINIGSKTSWYGHGDSQGPHDFIFEDCDLSNFPTTIKTAATFITQVNLVLKKCKVPALNLSNSHNFGRGDSIVFEYCSSTGITATPLGIYAGKNYYGLYNYVTNVYRYGTDGENNYSITLAGNANTTVTSPLQIPRPIGKWHKANNLSKLYVYFVSDDANLNDRDVWVNVSYNSHTSSPVGSFINTLANYGNQTGVNSSPYLKSANTNQWTGTGFSTAYRFEVAGIQPQEPGPITVDFYLGKPSTTVWVCPWMDLE